MTVLVLGASGMLGHKIFQKFNYHNIKTFGFIRTKIACGTENFIKQFPPNVFIFGKDALKLDKYENDHSTNRLF